MSSAELEERVGALEVEVRDLKRLIRKELPDRRPWWRRNAGLFANDPLFDEIVRSGEEYRRNPTTQSSYQSLPACCVPNNVAVS